MICVSCAADSSSSECPDLTGTYEVRPTPWDEKLHPLARRPRVQTRLFATLQRVDNGFTLIWHSPREEVVAAARAQAQRDPRRYGVWLDRVLRDPSLPLPLGQTEHSWVNEISNVGPVFRGVDEPLALLQCKEGWFLVAGPAQRDGPPDFEGGMDGTRELEFWLGRDEAGALSLKVEEHRTLELLRPGYFNVRGIRLWSRAQRATYPVVPEQDLTPLAASELPVGDRPSKRVPPCQITRDDETVFIHRLQAKLPPMAEIQGFSASIEFGRMRPDGTCDPTAYSVTLHAPDAASVAQIADLLRSDPFVRQIDAQESQTLSEGRVRVTFRMMAAPSRRDASSSGVQNLGHVQ